MRLNITIDKLLLDILREVGTVTDASHGLKRMYPAAIHRDFKKSLLVLILYVSALSAQPRDETVFAIYCEKEGIF